MTPMRIVILGLSITSSWGNGHATTYRGLVRELAARGHDALFLERDVPWYAAQRDLAQPPYGRTELYENLDELRSRFAHEVCDADAVIVGSYVPEGAEVGDWVLQEARGVTAFYDLDTPVTLAKLARGDDEYLAPRQIARYDLYLSFSGGATLQRLERDFDAPRARPLYCSCDPQLYFPQDKKARWDLGYLGTYSDDRQPPLQRLMLDAAAQWNAGRFCIAGPQYPASVAWPKNVERSEHLPPSQHREWYNAQRWTLNITRADMIRAGHSPSVRLFEAAACGVPIISDFWDGLDDFFAIDSEIVVSSSAAETLHFLRETSEEARRAIAEKARARVLASHTAAHRAQELETYLREVQAARVLADAS